MARVLALSGGIGGAKLALGLYRAVGAHELAVLVNTGDDFDHLGLRICPDVDTLLYTLSAIADRDRGWGRAEETWNFLGELRRLGGPDWFMLGDKDLALHVQRTLALREGSGLADFTAGIARQLGIDAAVLPMTDADVRTVLDTDAGRLEFQDYFVARRAAPKVAAIQYQGATTATPNDKALELLASPALQAVVLCPSNPWLSIAPMLAMPALRAALQATRAPIVAVSPIVGGAALKGPAAKIMAELGLPVSAVEIARYYGDLLDGFVLDNIDRAATAQLQLPVLCTDTVMRNDADKERLAEETMRFAASIA